MGVKVGDLNVNCLLNADDAMLIASLQCELQALEIERDEKGMQDQCKWQVNEVVYLGNMFSKEGRYEMDVERRITTGNRVNGVLAA